MSVTITEEKRLFLLILRIKTIISPVSAEEHFTVNCNRTGTTNKYIVLQTIYCGVYKRNVALSKLSDRASFINPAFVPNHKSPSLSLLILTTASPGRFHFACTGRKVSVASSYRIQSTASCSYPNASFGICVKTIGIHTVELSIRSRIT